MAFNLDQGLDLAPGWAASGEVGEVAVGNAALDLRAAGPQAV